jgi:hypothetical protein
MLSKSASSVRWPWCHERFNPQILLQRLEQQLKEASPLGWLIWATNSTGPYGQQSLRWRMKL